MLSIGPSISKSATPEVGGNDDEEEDEDLYGDITPELSGDINESINTTLSKYFE